MQITAAVTDGKGSFQLDAVELKPPQATEVLIEMKASGVCHTDYDCMQLWKERDPRPEDFRRVGPRAPTYIMGHEGSGVVLDTGSGVTSLKAGDRVLLNWAVPCHHCFQCKCGATNLCEQRAQLSDDRFSWRGKHINTSFALGTMATHALVPEQAVVKIDVQIPFVSASILGCGVMTGFGSAVNVAKVSRGSSVVVLGCGGVGLSVIQGARYCGAERIFAIDVRDSRLAMARCFGATETILADRADPNLSEAVRQIVDATSGRGADYAFECTAVPELGPAPLAFVRNGGVAVGVSGIEKSIAFNMELFEWDKVYVNPLYGQCNPARDFPLLLRLYDEGWLKLDEMVTRTYSLTDLASAFDDMLSGRIAKGVLRIE